MRWLRRQQRLLEHKLDKHFIDGIQHGLPRPTLRRVQASHRRCATSSSLPGSLGATGWASVVAAYYATSSSSAPNAGTTGGNGASAAKTYTVSNRNQLIQAFYANGARINNDGSFSGTLDTNPKIIYVSGTISLNMNKALSELSVNDYLTAGACSYTTFCISGRWNAQYDNISVMYATHVWIDHSNFSDGSRLDHDYQAVSSWYFGSSSIKLGGTDTPAAYP